MNKDRCSKYKHVTAVEFAVFCSIALRRNMQECTVLVSHHVMTMITSELLQYILITDDDNLEVSHCVVVT